MATTEQLNMEIQELKVKSGVHEQRLDKAEADIKQLLDENKAIYEINTNVRLLAEGIKDVKRDVVDVKEDVKQVKDNHSNLNEKFENELDSLKNDINDVRNLPHKTKAEWWDKVVWLIAGGFLSAIVTAIIATLTK